MTGTGIYKRFLILMAAVVAAISCAFAQGETIPPYSYSPLQESRNGDTFPKTDSQTLLPRSSSKQRSKYRKPDPELNGMVSRADSYFDKYSYTAAFNEYSKAIEYVKSHNLYDYYPDIITHIYMRLGKTAYYLGRYTSGMSVVYDLMRIYPDLDLGLKVQALTQLANYFIRLEKSSLAIRYLTDATVDLKRMRGDDKLRRKLESEIDIAFSSAYFFKGDSEKFLHYINKASKNCDADNISRVYQNMSINYLFL